MNLPLLPLLLLFISVDGGDKRKGELPGVRVGGLLSYGKESKENIIFAFLIQATTTPMKRTNTEFANRRLAKSAVFSPSNSTNNSSKRIKRWERELY